MHQYVNASDRNTLYYRYDVIAAMISALSLAFVGGMIFSFKKLQQHPNLLIGTICMLDSFTFAQIWARYVLCGYNLFDLTIKLFAYSV